MNAEETRAAAHAAIRHVGDLLSALNEAAAFPAAVTDGDREVLAHRLRHLNNAARPLLTPSVVTVKPTRPAA